jgi:DNA-binding transcriptional LysR family regulator
MLNIPTDLLRALVSVVDTRSFTKAAQPMGVTQPAVSAQIKRLQYLLGYEVLDKSTPGVSLTPRGEIVVNNARGYPRRSAAFASGGSERLSPFPCLLDEG